MNTFSMDETQLFAIAATAGITSKEILQGKGRY